MRWEFHPGVGVKRGRGCTLCFVEACLDGISTLLFSFSSKRIKEKR